MAEVLSQTEIDALLAAVSTGSVDTEETTAASQSKKKQTEWIAYDLTSQEKVIRARFAAFEGIHDRFSRSFRATLSHALKKKVSVNCTSTDFMRFSEYLANVLPPSSLNLINMTNLKGNMVFVVTSKLAYALVDAYYGGSERPFAKIGGREEFTSIETNMVRKICGLAIRDMKEAWRLNYPVDLEFQRAESNPHFLGAIHGGETVAVISFEVEFESLSGPFIVVLQLKALEAIQTSLAVNVTGEISADQSMWTQHWLREIQSIELEVRAELGFTEKTVREAQAFKPGDEMLLHQDAASPLTVYVEGLPKIKGLMGVCRGNSAVRITDLEPAASKAATNP
jgi:flagellar motor switch protein FliM